MTSTVLNVCTSEKTGVQKEPVAHITIVEGFGVEGDAHGGDWHRQVSLLADESAERMRKQGANVGPGDFGENILTRGIDLAALPVGTFLKVGDATLEVTQIGKECHTRCAIYHTVGTCVMPSEGIFCKVHKGGKISPGSTIEIIPHS